MIKKLYLFYLNSTDKVIASEIAEECAKQLGIKINNFYSRCRAIKNKKCICRKFSVYEENSYKEKP